MVCETGFACHTAASLAPVALDAARPGWVMYAHDVNAQTGSVERPVPVGTVTDWLRRQACDRHGVVERVAKLRYV